MEIVFNRKDAAIAKTIIQLVHNLGLSTIAEGVETEAQGTLLREMGCCECQGFYFSRLMPPFEIEKLLAKKS